MSEKSEKVFTVIDNKDFVNKNKKTVSKTVKNTTNPIARKLMEFYQERSESGFSVKDLFKK